MENGKCHRSGLFLSESHFSWHIACTHEPDGDCSEGGKQRDESSECGRDSTQGPSSGARAVDAWRTADSTPVLWVEGASGSQGRNCRTTWTGPERLAAGSTQFGVEETASRI